MLIGDSVTDVDAAHASGAFSIGYANKPVKQEAFAICGADAIVDDMATVARMLSAVRSHPPS